MSTATLTPGPPPSPGATPPADPSPGSAWWRFLPPTLITLLALALNAWGLSRNDLGNTYYAAASRSMSAGWNNFFFAAFDPGGFISVDKPPVALWIDGLSVRIFGLNSWSVLLPSAIAGAAAVALMYCVITRKFGRVAGSVAALVLALSPINVAVNRLNLPEPFLVLLLVAAAWATLRSFDSQHWVRWLVLAGIFVGLGFNTKMLAAYIPVPALALGIVLAAPKFWNGIKRAVLFGVATLVASAPWIVAVQLTPATSRPYQGGSTNNSVLDLVFGYNGLSRVEGTGQGVPGGGGGAGAGLAGPGGIFGGVAGTWRMWNDAVGGQIAWLLPVAAAGIVVAGWYFRRDRARRGAVALWGAWLLVHVAVFSYAQGIFHSYYTAMLAPAIAALVGIGGVTLAKILREADTRARSAWAAGALGVLAVTIAIDIRIADRTPGFYDWIAPLAVGLAVVAGIALAVGALVGRKALVTGALGLGCVAVLAIPSAWAVSETANPTLNATLPQAGPRGGAAGTSFGSASTNGDPELAAFLRAENDGETWDLVTTSATGASGLIAYDDVSVLALGGFIGSDPAATVDDVADLVEAGEVRFFQVGGGFGGGGGGPSGAARGGGGPTGMPVAPGTGSQPGMPNGASTVNGVTPRFRLDPSGFGGGASSQIMSAVQQACTPVGDETAITALPAIYSNEIYDCAGKADALRAVKVDDQVTAPGLPGGNGGGGFAGGNFDDIRKCLEKQGVDADFGTGGAPQIDDDFVTALQKCGGDLPAGGPPGAAGATPPTTRPR